MPWFKVDDGFHSHPKVLALRTGQCEAEALAVWAKAGSWCMEHLTDGSIPLYVVETLLRRNAAKGADELVRVRLWERTADGYRFRKWAEYQPSKDTVVTKRAKTASKVASWRERNQVTQESRNQVTSDPVTLPPTRPDPTHTQSATHSPASVREESPLKRRAERLREGYLKRFEVVLPNVRPHGHAQPGGGGPWLDLARECTDEDVDPLLNAFFVDDFGKKTAFRISVLVSNRVQLLASTQTMCVPQAAVAPERAAFTAAKAAYDRDPSDANLNAMRAARQALHVGAAS